MTKTPSRVGASLLLGTTCLLAACGTSTAPPASSGDTAATRQQASARLGDIEVRANAVPTTLLGEAVARQYGIVRDDKTVMLLVGVRRGPEAQEVALPAQVEASAIDLLGKRQAIAMREIRSGGFIDYVGVARVIPPDTLRFDVKVVPEGTQPIALQFNRDFF